MSFRDKLIRFLSGRYGADALYYGLLVLYVLLLILNLFFNTPVITVLMWAALLWMVFRAMSRNFAARRRENEVFLKFWSPIKNAFGNLRRRFTDRTHVYRRCPHCRATLRLPRKRGHHTVPCPRCGNRFDVHVLFGKNS